MTNTAICWLREVDAHQVPLVGGKGANLARLLRLGLPVPPGFVVTTDVYRAAVAAHALRDPDPERLRAHLLTAPLPDDISTAIRDAYRQLGAARVAVRSSGTVEDVAAASFAGQHDTFLNVVGPEALLAAVRGCWASLWSPRAVAYRREQGWDERALALAVVVQEMAPAEWAGVLFTVDPVSGRRDRLIVEAVPGLGEALVSGHAIPSRYVVEKASLRLLAGDAPLPPGVVEELARLGVRIETAFGAPQDIEWAYASGRCTVLQARPLTALRDAPVATATDGRRYSRLQCAMAPNALDHMPLPPYPFDEALFFRPVMARTLGALRSLGFAVPPLRDVLIEIADGVIQEVPPTIRPTMRALTLPVKLVTALRATPEDWLEDCRATLVEPARRIDREDLAGLSDADLLDRIATLQRRQVDLTVRRFGYLAPQILRGGVLALALRLAVGRDARRQQADLLAAVPDITTATNQELGRLVRIIRASEELHGVFRDERPDEIPARLGGRRAGAGFLAEMDVFLRCYGYRESAMPSAALPAWRDAPDLVYGLLKALVAGAPATSALDADDGQRAERARQTLITALAGGWLGLRGRLLLPRVLALVAAARSAIAFREDSHFYLFLAFPVIRRLALELGQRLVARGALDEPGDIFFLRTAEIGARGAGAEVRAIVRRRKAARRAVDGRYTAVPAALLEQTTTAGEVRGVAASPGAAVGLVRIIRDEREFWMLQRGEVLVARYTTPAWTPLFAVASAVIVDAGGMASHAAIVAREYGIPAVMGTGVATRRLHDGQRVVVDGNKGRVVLLGERGIQGART